MKSIQHLKDKIKGFGYADKSLILQAFIVILVAIGSFGLGRLSLQSPKNEKVAIVNLDPEGGGNLTYYKKSATAQTASVTSNTTQGVYVASKNGKLYYRVGCGASSRIKDENKIYFNTAQEAEDAGLQGSSSCTP